MPIKNGFSKSQLEADEKALEKSKAFWAHVEKMSRRVTQWPEWKKRAGAAFLQSIRPED